MTTLRCHSAGDVSSCETSRTNGWGGVIPVWGNCENTPSGSVECNYEIERKNSNIEKLYITEGIDYEGVKVRSDIHFDGYYDLRCKQNQHGNISQCTFSKKSVDPVQVVCSKSTVSNNMMECHTTSDSMLPAPMIFWDGQFIQCKDGVHGVECSSSSVYGNTHASVVGGVAGFQHFYYGTLPPLKDGIPYIVSCTDDSVCTFQEPPPPSLPLPPNILQTGTDYKMSCTRDNICSFEIAPSQ